ncbi:hypothetical protein GCM10010404_61310 [Nonomuraea africana]|uniref:Uncharacterized protein n=1 Tax=Nonomuraea africana TaxID=46171 RepID=A0ABR9K6K6_9ACTN|nr:hypothetical protein [Nonomuraea africana]MBE1557634.1 hypothetical protein [Nonomuraea africana]
MAVEHHEERDDLVVDAVGVHGDRLGQAHGDEDAAAAAQGPGRLPDDVVLVDQLFQEGEQVAVLDDLVPAADDAERAAGVGADGDVLVGEGAQAGRGLVLAHEGVADLALGHLESDAAEVEDGVDVADAAGDDLAESVPGRDGAVEGGFAVGVDVEAVVGDHLDLTQGVAVNGEDLPRVPALCDAEAVLADRRHASGGDFGSDPCGLVGLALNGGVAGGAAVGELLGLLGGERGVDVDGGHVAFCKL